MNLVATAESTPGTKIVDVLQTMKRWAFGILAAAITIGTLVLSPAVAQATDNGATVNRGACMSDLAQNDHDLVKYQSPGQTGNGPLTVVNGNVIVPNAYDGGVGCAR